MDEHLATFDHSIFDEPVGQSVEFFDVLLRIAVQIDIEVFEVFGPFCVLLARDVQDMRNS
jgi:hypothetical protein